MWRGRMMYGENRSVPIWTRVRITDESGHAIVMARVAKEPEIAKGDAVRVEISAGAVLLAFDAVAETAGHFGEQVTVRNPVNGQRVRAVVEAPGKLGVRK
jgi:flagella basal body P-ring formation protein FlgA